MAEDFFSVLRDRIVCGRRGKRNKKMKVGDKVQLRRRISQKGGKTRLATKKMKGFRERLRRMARKARLAENLRCFRKIPAWVCKQCIFRNAPVEKKI